MSETRRSRPTGFGRQPTVGAPARWSAPAGAAWRLVGPALSWLGREGLALFAMIGAALTVVAQLAERTISVAPALAPWLEAWRNATRAVWRPPAEWIGASLHPDIAAGLSMLAFLTLIGVGARVSARFAGQPLEPIRWRWFEEDSLLSLFVFQALCLAFLAGHSVGPGSEPLTIFGSTEIGRYAFPLIATFGYFAGDVIGHRAFHLRLYRLAFLVAALLGAHALALARSGGGGA